MPLCLEPGATFDVVLKADQAKPKPQPSFRFRFVSIRESVASEDRVRAMTETATGRQTADALCAEIKRTLVGWTLSDAAGAPIPYAPERLDELLTVVEAWELYYAAQAGRRLDGSEKNASGSPSPSSTVASAARAARVAPRTAQTP